MPAFLLGIALALATTSAPEAPVRRPIRATASTGPSPRPSAGIATPAPPARIRSRPKNAPRRTAIVFARAWLACTLHQGSCTHLPYALPAYLRALDRQPAASLATPTERASRPTVSRVSLTRDCDAESVATVTYTTSAATPFELHLDLVRERHAWLVFDVAETAPHIPPPPPLSRGPRGC